MISSAVGIGVINRVELLGLCPLISVVGWTDRSGSEPAG